MQRLRDHEIFEMTMLQWLRSKRFLGSLAFGGGTMLRLCHELPRFSLEMGFCFFKELDYERFYNRLYHALSQDHDVTCAQNNHESILLEIRREPRMPKFEIEIRKSAAPPGSTEEKIAFSFYSPTQVLVRGFTLREMLRNTVHTLMDHGDIRDMFDLEFLARKGLAFNLSREQREKVIRWVKGFKKRDLDVKLGSTLLPEVRDHYKQQGFAYLKEVLSFEE
jgi:hypothetical protein